MPWFRKTSDDAAVVLRVRAGKHDEFAVLVDRYLPVAHAVSYAQLRNVTDAEDAAQDAFLKAFESLDGLREPAKFGPWLLTIVRNICRNHQRSRAREAERVDAVAAMEEPSADRLEDRELRVLVRQQIEGLDDIHREALLLHYYGGRSIKEIAALLELSQDAVRKRLQRARDALSGQMLRHLEPAVAPERSHRDRVKTIMGLLAGVTAAWEASAASTTGAAGGAAAAGVAGTIASGVVAKIMAAVAAVLVVAGTVVYWPNAPEPTAQNAGPETAIAQSGVAAEEPQADRTDPTDRSDRTDHGATATADSLAGNFIRGRTVDQSGNAVANAALTLDPYDPGKGKHHETKSGDDGSFRFRDLQHTAYMLQATAPGVFGADDMSSDTAAEPEVHEIAMLPAGALDGVVHSKDGTPVSDALVTPTQGNWTGEEEWLSDRWQELRGVRTDADGRFHLAPVWLGSWKLQVDSPTCALYESDYLPADKPPVMITLTPGAHVEGRVVNAGTNTPVPDLKVSMYRGRLTETGRDGYFVLDGVQPGGNSVQIHDDKLISLSKGFIVPEGGDVTGVTVEVAQGGIIMGRVYDAQTGNGIRHAEVNLRTTGDVSEYGNTNEDETGAYRFARLRPGMYHVQSVQGPGYPVIENPVQDPLVVELGKTITGIDFGLAKGATIRGTVKAPPDAEFDRITVTVRYTDRASDAFRGARRDIEESEAGDFTISGLALGEAVIVQATAGAWMSETAGPFTLGAHDVEGVTLTLVKRPMGSVSGQLVYGGGVAAAGVGVNIRSKTRDRFDSASSDANGRFSFVNLVPGDYFILADSIGLGKPATEVSVGPGQSISDLIIDVGGGAGTITGQIVDDTGSPVSGADVIPRGAGRLGPWAKSDENGVYTLQGLDLESYDLNIRAEGYPSRQIDGVATGTKDFKIVLDRFGSVEGRVVDGRTGNPMTEFDLAVARADVAASAGSNLPYNRYVNESGEYRVDNAWPGSCAVVARAAGCFPSSTIVEVHPGQTISGVDLVVKPGAVVHATVVDPSGQPLAEAQVFNGELPYYFDNPRFSGASAKTGRDGTCTLGNLVPGTNFIYVYHPDYAPGEFTVDVHAGSSPSPTFTLTNGGTLEGAVTVDGAPVPGARVNFYYTEASFSSYDRIRPIATTGDDGSFRVDKLIAGSALVTVDSPIGRIRRTVAVASNQTTRLDINLETAGAKVSGTVRNAPGLGTSRPIMAALTVEAAEGLVQYSRPVDEAGHFEFAHVVAGPGTLVVVTEVASRRRVGKTAMFAIAPGASITRDFDFADGASVRGRITADSTIGDLDVALLAGQVDAAAVNNATSATIVEMRAAGMDRLNGPGPFRFDAVDPGEYTLLVATDGLGQVVGKPVVVPEGESVVEVDMAFP